MAEQSQNIGINLLLKVQEFVAGFTDAKAAGKAAADDIGQSFSKVGPIKPKVDDTAVNVVKTRIDELKAKLAELSEKKVSLGDIASINQSEAAIRAAESEVRQLGSTLSALGPEGQKAFEKLKLGAKETESPLSSLKNVAMGMFAAGGMMGAAREFGQVLKGVFDAGKEALQDEEKLTVAFKGNAGAAKEASENADKLAIKYNIMPGILKEISANAAIVGGATGKFNENVTELAAGFTKLNVPGLSATSVVRAFTKGAGDPEGAAGLGRLQQSFPLLAAGLAGITDPAEKARKAMEIMGPQFQMLQAQAGDSANASERMGVAMKVFQESVGKVLYGALAQYVIPVLSQFVQGLTFVSQAMDKIGAPTRILLGVVAGLTLALIVATAVQKAHLVAKMDSFVQGAREIVQKVISTAVEWGKTAALVAGTVATWLATAATAALSAAMLVLTSPVTLIVLGILALGAAVVWAYNNIAPFKDAVDAVGGAIEQAAEFVWKFKEYFVMLLGPVGLVIGVLMLLYEKVEFVHKAFDAIGGFFTKLFGGGAKEGADAVKAVQETFDKEIAARKKADDEVMSQRRAALQVSLSDIKANEDAGVITKQQADTKRAAAQKQFDDAAKTNADQQNVFLKQKAEEQTKTITAEYDKQRAALVQQYKDGKLSASEFEGQLKELNGTYATAKTAATELGDAGKKGGDDTAGAWKTAQGAVDSYAQSADDAKKQAETAGKSAAMWYQVRDAAIAKGDKAAVAAADKAIAGWKREFDSKKAIVDDFNKHTDEANKAGFNFDDKTPVKGKAAAQTLKEKYDAEKSAAESEFKDKSTAREREMIAEKASANEIRDALAAIERDKSTELLAIAEDYQKRSLSLNGKGAAKVRKEMTTAASDAGLAQVKGEEAARKVLEEERKATDLKELSELNQKQAEISKKRDSEIQNAKTYLRNKFGAEYQATAEFDALMASIDQHAKASLLDAQYAFDEKKRKVVEDARKLEIDEEKKKVEDKSGAAEGAAKGSGLGEYDKSLVMLTLFTAKKLALLNIDMENEKLTEDAKIKVWQAAQQKKIDLMDDGADKTAAQAALDMQVAQKDADEKTKLAQHYNDQKTIIEAQGAADRLKIIQDHLEKENVLYAAASQGLKQLWDGVVKQMTSAINQFFGFEKSGAAAMTANDIALAQSDKDNKIQALADEVKTNKISYQEYILQKTKLEEDYNKKMEGNSESLTDLLKKAEQSVLDSVLGAIAKKAEAWIADQLTRLALSLVYKATDTAETIATATTIAAAWAPGAALAATATAGGAAVSGGIALAATDAEAVAFAHLAGADEGLVSDPAKVGPRGRLIKIGETGKKEFASPETTARDYFVNDLGPQIMHLMAPKAQGVYQSLQANGGIIPPISPILTTASTGDKEMKALLKKATDVMSKTHTVLDNLHKSGIAIHGTSTIKGDHLEQVLRNHNKTVRNVSNTSGGGMGQ